MSIQLYSKTWKDGTQRLAIEFWALKQTDAAIVEMGTTRLRVMLNCHKLLWPEDQQHRWFLQAMRSMVEHEISIFAGCGDSGKSYAMYCHALIEFFAFPYTSLALISSTDERSLEIRIWGKLKQWYNRGKQRYPWLPGKVLDRKMCITPNEIDEDGDMARALTQGIQCVPCLSRGAHVGLGKFIGVKPPDTPGKSDGKLRHYGDEVQTMSRSFVDAYSNWYGKPDFKGVMSGNPIDISDTLCTVAEPECGWDAFEDTGKTQEWTSRVYNAHVVAFDGRDSPNNDQPGRKYPFLIDKKRIEMVAKTEGVDSWKYFSQCVGKPSKQLVSWRVITVGLCERHGAFEPAVWRAGNVTRLIALDPAYGGRDRCVMIELKFGPATDGTSILDVGTPTIVPVSLTSPFTAEEQIAEFVHAESLKLSIPASNIFYDSFGRGTLGFAFAKVFGSECPVPINAGDMPTARPVRFDLYVGEEPNRRLKRCNEEYSKFITEMWFAVRQTIESNQLRGISREIAEEGQARLYRIVSGNKTEVESKDEMKERIRKSPDLFDCTAIGCEGARRLGFRITRAGPDADIQDDELGWLEKKDASHRQWLESKRLEPVPS
jgi:hypothetical protein